MTVCTEKYFLTWDEAVQSGVQVAGGKGWNLGRLAQYGFKIPRGGVLTTCAYEEFIKYNCLQDMVNNITQTVTGENLDETNHQDSLNQLRSKIKAGTIPPLIVEELKAKLDTLGILERSVAVRSSASAEDSAKASFAGIHESFLNVRGMDIFKSVKECYASLWSNRAIAYRRKLHIRDDEVITGVVVMEMVEAQAAGVGFTCDPQTGRQNIVVINANFGLGETIVTGSVEPDTYYLDASPWNSVPHLIERRSGRKEGLTCLNQDGGTQFVKTPELAGKQVLSEENIEKLGLLLLRVFEALGDCDQHQDVEWVFDGRDFILVQSRPVTSLPRRTFAALKNQPDIWSNGNYRDAVPMVLSPLIRRLTITTIDKILKSNYSEIGYSLPDGLQFSRFFNGRLYCNLSALQWAMYDAMGALPREFNIGWGGHQPEIELKDPKPYKGLRGMKRLWRGIKSVILINRAAKKAPEIHARFLDAFESLTQKGFSHLQDKDLIQRYNELNKISIEFTGQFSFLSGAASIPIGGLMKILSKYFGERAPMVLNALMVGGAAGITSADHGYRLVELAEIARRDNDAVKYFDGTAFDSLDWEGLPEGSAFKQAFREFIKEYGHRGVYELDIINPRWNEDPSYLLNIIRSTINTADLRQLKAKQKEKFDHAWQEIETIVPSNKHSSIKKLISKAQEGAAVREKTKSVLAVMMEVYRKIAQELGFRFCQRAIIEEAADIYFCTWPELVSILNGQWNGVGLKALITKRKVFMKEMESIAPPDIIMGDTPKYTEASPRSSGNFLTGVPVASGKASGKARLISHPAEGNRLQPGDVMVAPSTDPGWTPLFLKASAVIMETGGFLSHGAIVAREYGIPAVVNIPGVMTVIQEGWKVDVDGDEGKVFLKG
ncbi:PEP/pyruvate-binding domain-containing protein [Desulfosporosinus meridiei]|uniref:Phosphoenolpyruvate synthase/pyruvate phosphate dikinase n=1 Tax=Desulfosporosinus meridiei (strain ATCC BAA-275 / DSM 13257 / KCTC 12902 / NCIMB 13706 / S10) TaxID=768704 RepID=J7J338_DESMD|nr:PEP/pyruvate-binding domain-containing protein [Desulfosporosinus meridiei]AFQ45371.1 phosphoenolpyruvate synthase/pyruvate phosphate dikinase [Desulfosporosinus meridiei DSM 13257]